MVIFRSYISLPGRVSIVESRHLSACPDSAPAPRSRPEEDTHSAASWDVNDL